MFRRSSLPRPKISLIVDIYTVGNSSKPVLPAIVFHELEELVFAMETALGIIFPVVSILKLAGVYDRQSNSLLFRKGNGVGQLGACQAGRIGDHRAHLPFQNFV